jgi:hypothetical protein
MAEPLKMGVPHLNDILMVVYGSVEKYTSASEK